MFVEAGERVLAVLCDDRGMYDLRNNATTANQYVIPHGT